MFESGWVGMQGVPSNNDYAHMPWFHFDPEKAAEADIGVTKHLSDFVLKYAGYLGVIYNSIVDKSGINLALFDVNCVEPVGKIETVLVGK